MKYLRTVLIFVAGVLIAIKMNAQIDISLYADKKTTIVLSKPGKLSRELNKIRPDIENLTALVVEGNINGTDVKFINELVSLEYLDLSKACVIPGGKSYAEINQTTDQSKKVKYKIEEQNVVP